MRTKPVRISFLSRAGEKIKFPRTDKITKPVKISFLARAKRGRVSED